jgi:hypothetical protein
MGLPTDRSRHGSDTKKGGILQARTAPALPPPPPGFVPDLLARARWWGHQPERVAKTSTRQAQRGNQPGARGHAKPACSAP